MLIVTSRAQSEHVSELDRSSSAFASCIATLANARIGVRAHIPGAPERTRRSQLLADGMYAPGVGVAREIVSLPAPRILYLCDVETGLPATSPVGAIATVTLALDSATVTSVECIEVEGRSFELTVRQFLAASDEPAVFVAITLRQTNGEGGESRRLRLAYGLDEAAANEYLGKSAWLTARYYELESRECSNESLHAMVATGEHRLRYDVQFENSHSGVSLASMNRRFDDACLMLVTFDFSASDCHWLNARWQVRADACARRPPATRLDFAGEERRHLTRWRALWKDHDVSVDAHGAPVELGVRYAIFQLLQHGIGSHDRPNGTLSPARGLTSTYHSGATFFDTELHKCMFWVWNDPRVARSLLDYRYRRLSEAIAFAKSTGYSGARFPEASNDQGRENGPHYVLSYPNVETIREWSVEEVLHISADICYALYRYWETTGDDVYMLATGCTLVLECARFAASVFKWSDSKQAYVIERVMGPDEYHYHVDNSFYTNYMLRWNLEFALSLVDRRLIADTNAEEIELWRSISGNVYLPWMTVDGTSIPEEFEGYAALSDAAPRSMETSGPQFSDANERDSADKLYNFLTKAIKQADVILLMSMFPHSFSHEVKQSALRFYGCRTVHESSLSYGPHAVVAAHIGATDDCAGFITRASRYNLDFTPIGNYSNGLHLSAYAGAWQGLVQGLAGLRVVDDRLHFRPRLPANWNSYQFAIWFRGRRLSVTVPRDGAIEIDCNGRALVLESHSEEYIYRDGGLV